MWVTGFHPRPWNPAAVLSIGNLLSFAGLAIAAQENERLLLELVQTGIQPELLRELMAPYLDNIDIEPLREIRIERRLSDEALEMLADLPRLAARQPVAVTYRVPCRSEHWVHSIVRFRRAPFRNLQCKADPRRPAEYWMVLNRDGRCPPGWHRQALRLPVPPAWRFLASCVAGRFSSTGASLSRRSTAER